VKDDIFDLPSKFSLAHCVCEDFCTSMGMTAEFKYDNHIYIFLNLIFEKLIHFLDTNLVKLVH